ncbi:MAG: menaquinol-cytochrome c reductase cytochrome b/c subunit [Gaiellaceae bacterium]|jgi:mono/diheme cytochrome c family protein|nr:menaquinol-cytochrome c reductase cytochrome b/c subunit [Gaiellaceae bacterium]
MAVMKEKPSRTDLNRASFAKYKADVKKRGKPFFPYAMFHDTIMSLVVVATIVGLAVIWKWSAWPVHHDPTYKGLLGPEIDPPADPGTTSFVPRPDWYFYFLFYLLRIFKWPDSVFLGTVGLPTILLMLLIGLPFLDRRRTRKISQRPVAMVAAVLVVLSMGVLTWKGATAQEALASEVKAQVPKWQKDENLPAEAMPGANLFAVAGCTACHTYDGSGGANLGAPDLTDIGAKNLGKDFQIRHLKCPPCVNSGSPMPKFESLGQDSLEKLAIFLEASKGTP